MQPEIEAKFLNVDHDVLRKRLAGIGAVLEKPKRMMRRTVFDYPDSRIERSRSRLRVRDEGDRVTITYKSPHKDDQYVDETETTVGSYEIMVELLQSIGLVAYSNQESTREVWRWGTTEIMLDEWPWVKPFMEIEGPDEAAIKACAGQLGLQWERAVFGSAEAVYQAEYPGIENDESLGAISQIRFNAPVPPWLKQRRQR